LETLNQVFQRFLGKGFKLVSLSQAVKLLLLLRQVQELLLQWLLPVKSITRRLALWNL
jgi:hypothetical protein